MKHFSKKAFLIGLVLTFLNACDSDSVKLVKNSPVFGNNGISIDKLFSTYSFCKNGEWEEFVSDRGVNYVTFKCDYTGNQPYKFINDDGSDNLLKYLEDLYNKNPQKLYLISQFIISTDKKSFDNNYVNLDTSYKAKQIYPENTTYRGRATAMIINSLLNNESIGFGIYPEECFKDVYRNMNDYYQTICLNNLQDFSITHQESAGIQSIKKEITDFYQNNVQPQKSINLNNFKYDSSTNEISCHYELKFVDGDTEIVSREGSLKGKLAKPEDAITYETLKLSDNDVEVELKPSVKDKTPFVINNHSIIIKDDKILSSLSDYVEQKYKSDVKSLLAKLSPGKYIYNADKSNYVSRTGAKLNEGSSGFIEIKKFNEDNLTSNIYLEMTTKFTNEDFFTHKLKTYSFTNNGKMNCKIANYSNEDEGINLKCEYRSTYEILTLNIKAYKDHLEILERKYPFISTGTEEKLSNVLKALENGYLELNTGK
ncbi:hypothetical protein SAMN02910357_00114 [Succinivibrio dextrinosolvens]|uniref:hypothetical protein n=1 Tax=Succinivibrio dextrinosolvens TaxID=83771 RepID=UPI0008E55B6E|nr:hypothetical protein [Succinivibrio dextrinosolvens]SFS32247.1 hypothetical protein SAMN02910357_00114 [Succinivibrio dextrinosolvens]